MTRQQQQAQATFTQTTLAIEARAFPSPAELAEYEVVVPGMGQRLLATFEDQAKHRMTLETYVVKWDVIRSNVGLGAGFIFGIVVLAAAFYLILNGHEGTGVVTIIVEFLAYGGVFLYGSESRRRERARQARGG